MSFSVHESLLSLMPYAVVSMDTAGRITAFNRGAEQLFSLGREEAVGQPYPAVFGPSLSDRVVKLLLYAGRQEGPAEPQQLSATLRSGEVASLRASAGPVRNADGHLVGVLFVAERDANPPERPGSAEPESESARAARLRAALERYAGPHVAAWVDERPSFVQVGGVRQIVTAVHADVRGYTTMAEVLEPEAVAQLLRRYHSAGVEALVAAGGTFDHFIGDSVLALWNAPIPQEGHAQQAIGGAIAFQKAVRQVGSELHYGIGVHTGEAVVGNLGSDRYVSYTAIGDSINLAARLQAAAEPGQILCSRVTLEALDPAPPVTPLGELAVKGRMHPIEAFRIEWRDL